MSADTKKMLQESVNHIAEMYTKCFNGELEACDGEWSDVENGETLTLWDMMTEPGQWLDVDYIVGSDKKTLKGVVILECFGGPTIRTDTFRGEVVGWWGTDTARAWLPSEVANEINEVFEEIFNC